MSGPRDRALALASLAFGAMWLFAAGAKIAAPLEAYEFAARVVDPGASAKLALAATVGAEAALGAAMALRVVRGFGLSLVAILAAEAALVHVRAQDGALVPCGCFGEALGATVDQALLRNAVLAAALVGLIVWERRSAGRPSEAPAGEEVARPAAGAHGTRSS